MAADYDRHGAAARRIAEEHFAPRPRAGAAARGRRGGAVTRAAAHRGERHARRRARPGRRLLGGAAVRARAARGSGTRSFVEPVADASRRRCLRYFRRVAAASAWTRARSSTRDRRPVGLAAELRRPPRRRPAAEHLRRAGRRGAAGRASPCASSRPRPGLQPALAAAEGIDLGLARHTASSRSAARSAAPAARSRPAASTGYRRCSRSCSTVAGGGRPRTTRADDGRQLAGYGSVEHDGVHYGQKAHSMRALLDLPRCTGARFVLALAIHPDERADLRRAAAPRLAAAGPAGGRRHPGAYRGVHPGLAGGARHRQERLRGLAPAAGSAIAASATSPRAGRSSRRRPASAPSCRPARGCSRSDASEAAAAIESVRARLRGGTARGARPRRGRLRLRPRARAAAGVSVSDAELAAGLRAALGGRSSWRPAGHGPPHEPADGGAARSTASWLLFKDLAAGPRPPRPAFLIDPLREIAVYREILGARGGRRAGAATRPPWRRRAAAWLVPRARRRRAAVAGAATARPGRKAARWLAGLHAGGRPPARGTSLRHDAAVLRRWLRRGESGRRAGALAGGRGRRRSTAVAELAACRRPPARGVLPVERARRRPGSMPRIHPLDWEMAGVGPGVMDLAALSSGAWSATQRGGSGAYRAALPTAPADRPALAGARHAACGGRAVAAAGAGVVGHRPSTPTTGPARPRLAARARGMMGAAADRQRRRLRPAPRCQPGHHRAHRHGRRDQRQPDGARAAARGGGGAGAARTRRWRRPAPRPGRVGSTTADGARATRSSTGRRAAVGARSAGSSRRFARWSAGPRRTWTPTSTCTATSPCARSSPPRPPSSAYRCAITPLRPLLRGVLRSGPAAGRRCPSHHPRRPARLVHELPEGRRSSPATQRAAAPPGPPTAPSASRSSRRCAIPR